MLAAAPKRLAGSGSCLDDWRPFLFGSCIEGWSFRFSGEEAVSGEGMGAF